MHRQAGCVPHADARVRLDEFQQRAATDDLGVLRRFRDAAVDFPEAQIMLAWIQDLYRIDARATDLAERGRLGAVRDDILAAQRHDDGPGEDHQQLTTEEDRRVDR